MNRLTATMSRIPVLLAAVIVAGTFTLPGDVLVAGSVGAETGATSTATTKNWTVTIWVSRTTVERGVPIAATVALVNRTSRTIRGGGCSGINYEMALTNSKTKNTLAIPTVACSWFATSGTHIARTTVKTTWLECGGYGLPRCSITMKHFPALPPGTYHTLIQLPVAKGLPTSKAITVRLTA